MTKRILLIDQSEFIRKGINSVPDIGMLAIAPGANVAGQVFERILVGHMDPHPRNADWLREVATRLANENSKMIYL